MADRGTEDLRQSTLQKATLIADRLFGAGEEPREASNGVPVVVAVLSRRRTWVVGAAVLAALVWRASRRRRRR